MATNVALKIVCRRHVTRIHFLYNNVALKIVPCHITLTVVRWTIYVEKKNKLVKFELLLQREVVYVRSGQSSLSFRVDPSPNLKTFFGYPNWEL